MTDTRVDLAIAGSCVRVVQVTDTHLEERRGGTLLGMDTDASLAHVLDLVRDAPLRPDLLLATGDLANHGAEAAYVRVRESFDALGLPWFWLPGNHDAGPLMHGVIGRGRPMIRSICAGSWQIVMLDSTVAGQVGGSLGAAELALLEHAGLAEGGGGDFSARARHVDALVRCQQQLASAREHALQTGDGDLAAEDLRLAHEHLGEITGRFRADDLLGEIFGSFCIGK